MRGGIAVSEVYVFEIFGKPSSVAADALQFWGASGQHYAAK